MSRYPSGPLTPKEVRRAARAAITAFEEEGINCCLFGSLACHIYGMRNRDPNDVDLIVLNPARRDAEDLKQFLVEYDDDFYLVDSRKPEATYQVLWYHLPSPRRGPRRSCKVDILTTGQSTSLDIPRVPNSRVERIHPHDTLPVMPLLALLLMKLQGWVDHRHSRESHKQAKVRADVADIRELVNIALDEQIGLSDPESKWMPKWFINQMQERVDEYVKKFPGSQRAWDALGF